MTLPAEAEAETGAGCVGVCMCVGAPNVPVYEY
jgi:hypothetical protein